MRSIAEPRNLALAITRRASCIRNFSAGIGRGRGGGSGKYDDAEEPLFSGSFGHGAPQGGPLNAGFLGRGGPPNSASGSPGGLGRSSAGRGFNNLNQPETPSLNNGPLFSNATSFGRGSVSRNQNEDPFSDAKPQQRPPSLNLGSVGFGRGKPVEKNDALPEDIFSADYKGTLSSWSKWDQKLSKMDTKDAKDGPSPAELRLLQDESSSTVLPFSAIPQQQLGQRGQEKQTQDSQSSASASPLEAASLQQRPPSPHGRQPIRQTNLFEQVSPSYTSSSAGWQQPAQQPYHDIRFQPRPPMQNAPPPTGWQQPAQQPYHDIRFQPRPSMQNAAPPTGWPQPVQPPLHDTRVQLQPPMQSTPPPTGWQQPVQQPYYDATVQPQPFMQYTPPPTDLSLGWQQPVQQPYYDASVPPQPFMQYTPSPTGLQQQTLQQPYYDAGVQQKPYVQYTTPPTAWQPPASVSPVQATIPQQRPPPGSPGRQPIQELRGKSNQLDGSFATDDWQPPSSGGSMQVPRQPFDRVKPFSELHQGQYPYGGESVESPPVAQTSSFDVSGNKYDWSSANSESILSGEPKVLKPIHGTGLDYEGKVEELYKQNKLEDIDGIYSEMKSAQIRPSAKTYGTILQSYLQRGQMDKVSMIYQEMSGVLFTKEKNKDEEVKGTSPASSAERPTPHHIGGAAVKHKDEEDRETSMGSSVESPTPYQIVGAASTETPSSGQGAHFETKYAEDGGLTFSRNIDTPSTLSDKGVESFTSFGQPEPSVGRGIGRGMKMDRQGMEPSIGTGRGRGKKVESFFNFDFSGGLGSADQGAELGKESLQLEQKSKTEVPDEYSQTFTPVIQPGWYAFAPEGLSVGPGVGRGRPQSPQAGLGSSTRQQSGSGLVQGSSSYEQRMQAALQQAPPLYSRDSGSLPAEPQYAEPEEEPLESSLSAEEAEAAAERAMQILKRFGRFQNVFEDDDQVVKRSPLGLARSLKERKQPKKSQGVEKAVRLTAEEEKKEAARLKVMEENETLQELQHTFDQFLKVYGEMAVEPEHELGDFTNPDIEEKPFMPLEEYLEKAKPNIMKTGLVRSEKEWQDMVKDTMRHLPIYEEFAERYGGPGRYTAKQENEDLEEIAGTLPSDVGRAAKSFVQRSLTTMKSNPGLNLHQKQWLLASMVDEFSQYIVND